MVEKSAAAVQTASSRPPVKTGKPESTTERIERLYDVISRRAFELFERDGRADGHHIRHWFEAERELLHPAPINMEVRENDIALHIEVPGFTAADLEVTAESRRVTISGKRESRNEIKDPESLYTEESSDEIFRSFTLPSEINAAKVSATLKDGVLDIVLPKIEPKKLSVPSSRPSETPVL